MSFTKSSRNISITSDFLLTAECKQINGQWKRSFLQLNSILGNADGALHIESRDFSKSAKDVYLREEGGSTILHANLRRKDQTWNKTFLNLDVIVANRNGILYIDTSTIQPPSDVISRDYGDYIEKLVEDCRKSADDLKKQIHDRLAKEADATSRSVSTAFKGIQQMQEALSDGGVYAQKEDFGPEAGHLGFLLKDATTQWSRVEDAMALSIEEIKGFQFTNLGDAAAKIERLENEIAAEVDETMLKQKEAKEHLRFLQEQISEHQKEYANVTGQRQDATLRTIGFSVASALVPFLIPFAVMSSAERGEWDEQATELSTKIAEASCTRDRLDGLQIGLERVLQAANRSAERCRRLRAEVDRLPDELAAVEQRIREKKDVMAEYAQALAGAETGGVTAFQYSQTLQEGREILDEVLSVKEEFEPEQLHVLLRI